VTPAPAGDEGAQVRELLTHLSEVSPGRSVELRVPPHGAVQLIAGPVHRRGTPKATIEMSATTLFDLATGALAWEAAVHSGAVLASGERTDLGGLFPLSSQSSPH